MLRNRFQSTRSCERDGNPPERKPAGPGFNPRARVSATFVIANMSTGWEKFQSTRSCERDLEMIAHKIARVLFQSTRSCERDYWITSSVPVALQFQSTRSCERDYVLRRRAAIVFGFNPRARVSATRPTCPAL